MKTMIAKQPISLLVQSVLVLSLTSTAGAAAPVVQPAAGGLPRCQATLNQCKADLANAEKFPATGQTKCSSAGNSGQEIDCAGTGQDGEIQAGGHLHYTDNGDTITDDNTKLEWEKKLNWDTQEDQTNLHDADNTYTWGDAFDVFIKDLNTEPCFAEHCDWRLPNVKELQSIVDYDRLRPAIDPIFVVPRPPARVSGGNWWTSTSDNEIRLFAWAVTFQFGGVQEFFKTEKALVRAVRGGLTH
jgi:hypothetical protein